MRARTLFSLGTAALSAAALVAAASPAAAQSSCAQSARAVATYNVEVGTLAAPAKLVVADSAGKLVAQFYFAGEERARPMSVVVRGGDLVVRGESARGAVELVLYGQNESTGGALRGRWTIGQERGALRGVMRS